MNIQHLRSLIETVRAGSISAAARKLQRSQSTVSSAIASLEVDLGVTLLDRSGHKPQLTADGKRLLPEMIRTLDQCEHLHAVAESLLAGAESSIRIVYDSTTQSGDLRSISMELVQKHLSTSFRFDLCFGTAEEEILAERADLGLVTRFRSPNTLVRKLVVNHCSWGFYCHRDHPLLRDEPLITSKTLSQHLNIVLDEVHQASAAMMQLGKHTIAVNSPQGMLELLTAQVGFSLMPSFFIDAYAKPALVNFCPQDLPAEFRLPCYLIWNPNRPQGPIVRDCLEHFQQAII